MGLDSSRNVKTGPVKCSDDDVEKIVAFLKNGERKDFKTEKIILGVGYALIVAALIVSLIPK